MPETSASQTLVGLRQQRVGQILWLLIPSFGLLALLNLRSGYYQGALLESLAMALLGFAQWINARGHYARAAQLTLGVLLWILVMLMTSGAGLLDEVPLAYPGLLIFAGMFGSRRLIMLTTAVLLASLIATALWHSNVLLAQMQGGILQRLVIVILILVVTTIFLWLGASDLRFLVKRLEAETSALALSNERISRLAYHDELTHLPNRALAARYLQQRLALIAPGGAMPGASIMVVLLDLDHFKNVNDSLGHEAGNTLLSEVALRLKLALGEENVVARLSGDEFLVVLGPLGEGCTPETGAAMLMRELAMPFELAGMRMQVSASLGISMAPGDGRDAETLLKAADLAMYQAKASGRGTFRFFNPGMETETRDYLALANALRIAMAQGDLQLHYQPQCDLRTGQLVGAEALLRWQHPEMGWIAPTRVIPVAETSGLIHELGGWVVRQAFDDLLTLRARGLDAIRVAINVSPLQFQRGHTDYLLLNQLDSHALPPDAIELEMTEEALANGNERQSVALARLREAGVPMAIDDFGTGYSNLGNLQRLAVRRLKIDRSFTTTMRANERTQGIVRAIVEMARCLQIEVVAEGVEDAQTLDDLRQMGCQLGQGFYWSPALPLADFVAFAQAHAGLQPTAEPD